MMRRVFLSLVCFGLATTVSAQTPNPPEAHFTEMNPHWDVGMSWTANTGVWGWFKVKCDWGNVPWVTGQIEHDYYLRLDVWNEEDAAWENIDAQYVTSTQMFGSCTQQLWIPMHTIGKRVRVRADFRYFPGPGWNAPVTKSDTYYFRVVGGPLLLPPGLVD